MIFYRIQSAGRDAQALLDPTSWESRCYGGGTWIDDPETGESVEDVRRGISSCASVEDLAAYIAGSAIEWGIDPVLLEMEADIADDDDHDADRGAVLVWPTRIATVTDLDDTDFYDRINAILDGE